MADLNLRIPALPAGTHKNATVFVVDSPAGTHIFCRTESGLVLAVRPRGAHTDLTHDFGMNDRVRACYAKAAGVTLKEIKAAVKKQRDADAERTRNLRMKNARECAKWLGYKLVKIKEKNNG